MYNVPTRQSVKFNCSEASFLLSEKHSRKSVEHCEQGFYGSGEQSGSNINGLGTSDLIKNSDVVLSVQSSLAAQ